MQHFNPFKPFPIHAGNRNSSRGAPTVPRLAYGPESHHSKWPGGASRAESENPGLGVVDGESPDAFDAPGAVDHGDDRSLLQLYLNEIRRTALLSPEQETQLALRIKNGDQAARDHMIKANLRLVVKIAYSYFYLGLPILDLISEGNLGLIRAVERFDPTKGGKLSTYAAWWIKQSMKRAVANQSKTIRLPMHLVDRIARMRAIIARYVKECGREPDNEEIAYELGIPVRKVALLKTVSVSPASLEAPLRDDGDTRVLGDIVGDDNARSPQEHLTDKALIDDLRKIVNSLGPREAKILTMRFGLDGGSEMTLEEVGQRFNITRERIRQLQDLAMRQIRHKMNEWNKQRSWSEVEQENRAIKRAQILREFAAQRGVRCASTGREPQAAGQQPIAMSMAPFDQTDARTGTFDARR